MIARVLYRQNVQGVLNYVLGKAENTRTHGRDNLRNLWSGYLMERGQYKKAAYLLVMEGVRPNLPLQVLEHHMENGLRKVLSKYPN